MSQKGLFIVLDGPDGCGKSTQAKLLFRYLNQLREIKTIKEPDGTKISIPRYEVKITKEPGGTTVGAVIRPLLLGSDRLENATELFLFLADRAEHIAWITDLLKQGVIVICDRFNASTFAYQVAGRLIITRRQFDVLDKISTGGLTPDLSILLNIDPAVGFARIADKRPDRIEQAGMDFHQRVQLGFLELVQRRPQDNWMIINANQSIDEIAQQIQGAVKLLLSRLSK